jgi:Flp pilus assembly protein TadD
MNWDTFSMVGRTFAEVFPNSLLVRTVPWADPLLAGHDYLLIGFKNKSELSLENIQRRLRYAHKSQNVKIQNPKVLYNLIVSENLQELFGPGPINTDSYPGLEFAAPKLMYYNDADIFKNIEDKTQLSKQTEETIEEFGTNVDLQIDFAVYALSLYSPFPDMIDFSKATASQKIRFFKLMDDYFAENMGHFTIYKNEQLRQRAITINIAAIENKIDALPNKAISYFHLGYLYSTMGMLDKAISNCQKALQFKQDDPEILASLGILLGRKGDFNKAVKYYKNALQFNPYYAKARYNLGMAQLQLGQVDAAVNSWKQTIALEATNYKIKALNNLGIAHYNKGRTEEAVTYWREALKINPDFIEARKSLHRALTEMNRSN